VASVSKSESQKQTTLHQLMKKQKNLSIYQERVDNKTQLNAHASWLVLGQL
jgi:hypothetical protein